jgi:hypothetical protein
MIELFGEVMQDAADVYRFFGDESSGLVLDRGHSFATARISSSVAVPFSTRSRPSVIRAVPVLQDGHCPGFQRQELTIQAAFAMQAVSSHEKPPDPRPDPIFHRAKVRRVSIRSSVITAFVGPEKTAFHPFSLWSPPYS